MQTRVFRLLTFTALLFGTQVQPAMGKDPFNQKVIDKAKKAVVTIHGNASLTAYNNAGNWSGTGFLVNKRKGLVLTNAHVAGGAVIGTYYLFFHDGTRADAKVLYYDPWQDYAFLQVDPKAIPRDVTEIKFSAKDPVMNQPAFVIGNNEGKNFSIHTGNVSSIYGIEGLMPQHSIILSLNTKGGSSGSPILNTKGEAIALNYAASATFGVGLHPSYLRYALRFIEQGKTPPRKHIGAIVDSYSLNECVKYRNFPQEKIKGYTKKFPSSLNYALQVRSTLQGSPAAGKLLPGDIIWAVNGKELGPNLVDLDMAMNTCEASSVCLTICRNGEWSDVEIALYSPEAHKIQRMVSFGGALFFEMDDSCSSRTGAPAKTLTFVNVQSSTSFNKLVHYEGPKFVLKVEALNESAVTSLDQLIEAIPQLVDEQYFTIDYLNYIPVNSFGYTSFAHKRYKADVAYDENAPAPKLFTLDRKNLVWKGTPILKR